MAIIILSIALAISIGISGWLQHLRLKTLKEAAKLKRDNARLIEIKIQLEADLKEFLNKLVLSDLTIVDSERRKIGADLHDFLGSMLWAVKVQLELVVRKDELNTEGMLAINKAREIIEDTLDSTRSLVRNLIPKTLLTEGLSQAIREHCDRISTDMMLFEFIESGEPHFQGSVDNKLVVLFRVVQELLNNCLKYSEAKIITVYLNWGASLIICFTNNGKAFQMEDQIDTKDAGVGSYSIKDRVNALDGTITSEAGPPNTLYIEFPYK